MKAFAVPALGAHLEIKGKAEGARQHLSPPLRDSLGDVLARPAPPWAAELWETLPLPDNLTLAHWPFPGPRATLRIKFNLGETNDDGCEQNQDLKL